MRILLLLLFFFSLCDFRLNSLFLAILLFGTLALALGVPDDVRERLELELSEDWVSSDPELGVEQIADGNSNGSFMWRDFIGVVGVLDADLSN